MSYKVISGDTLIKIAKKFGTTYQELARINGISNPNLIRVGQIIKLPNSSSSSSPSPSLSSTFISYSVASGDTLIKIAKRYGTTYQEIARINGISNPNIIRVGQVLKIPCSNSTINNTPSISTSSNQSEYISYKIVSGDTLSKIANRFGTNYQELARINGISNPNIINVGQIIKVPKPNSYINTNTNNNSNSSSNFNNTNPKTINIQVKNTDVLDALRLSPWYPKAKSLSVAFYVILDNKYSVECAIGLMANLVAEGNYGIVEYSFSKNHSYNFYLPSGGVKCKTIKDIEYVRDWPTTNDNTSNSKLKRGSCGFGSVQWSFGRRVNFANMCLSIMKNDSDVNDENWAIAEATFITQELKNGYYSRVESAALKAGGSVADWAEAFADKYEIPSGSDRNMSGTGPACIKRRKNAVEIYNYLKSKNVLN